ncbi:DUF6366 family protein [Guptibacillus algicola]|uniref:DUF6366 family protein n=1 Tax=Guptibacillus algicola TaxID=225844 RepID=UPI001CD36BFA|nr:DUF6366 family protein [Alkalihalobacillus algicola]MCA0987147.1 DUF6366 family protein [Alkalihalobacillus algicola]
MTHDVKSSENQSKKGKSENDKEGSEGTTNHAFKREPCIWDRVDGLGPKAVGLIIFGIILLFLMLSFFI